MNEMRWMDGKRDGGTRLSSLLFISYLTYNSRTRQAAAMGQIHHEVLVHVLLPGHGENGKAEKVEGWRESAVLSLFWRKLAHSQAWVCVFSSASVGSAVCLCVDG